MTRRLATALASAALFAFISAPSATSVAQTGATPRTGEKTTKAVQTSCPVHPEVKARAAGRCPKCRAEERRQRVGKERNQNNVTQRQQAEGTTAND